MNPMTGVIHVTGEHDTGKTTFALECGVPAKQIVFFDDDVKGQAVVEDLGRDKFGVYLDLVQAGAGMPELEFFTFVKEKIDSFPDRYGAIIFDPWTRFAKSMHSYVLTHPTEFRKNYAPMGSIKGAQQWQDTRRLEAEILGLLLTKAPLVILVSHLKSSYVNQVKTGKMEPDSSNTLERVCRLRLWLRQNPSGSPVPIALVLKRADQKILTDEGNIRTVSILPRKLVPEAGERSLWDTINRYREHPIDTRPCTEAEMPDSREMAILDGTLTEDQKFVMLETLRLGLVGPDEEPETTKPETQQPELTETQRGILETRDMSPADTVGQLQEAGLTMSIPEVVKWRRDQQ